MTTNQPRTVSRLWWIIRTTLLIFIVGAFLTAVFGGLGYAGYLGVKEIQRSNNSLLMRIEANEQNLNALSDLVNSEFARGNPAQQVQINQMINELATLTRQLESLQAAQVADTAVQTEQLTVVEADLATTIAQNSDLANELAAVQAALVALQSDLNSIGVRLDELGGDLDRLRLQLGTVDETLTELTTETAAAREEGVVDLQQSLTLLQLWGMLTNARLALLDNDVAFAETAVTQAIALADTLTTEPDTPAAAALQRLQTRLNLAAAGLATNLPLAAQDLAAASRELTLLMSSPTAEAELVEISPTPTGTVTGTAVPTTATPLPTPSPSPTPTATP